MRISLVTLGCRVNQAETSILKASLEENGAIIVNIDDNPDYCIINTCTVTSKSDYNSRQLIRRAAKAGAKVIVTGCYSELNPQKVAEIEGVSGIVGMSEKNSIVAMITGNAARRIFPSDGRSRPNVKVQDGCNFSCAYCAVPIARGRSRSVPQEQVLEQVVGLEEQGYRELVLTGIHLGSYGHDHDPKSSLSHLIRGILRSTSKLRVRLSSLEINEINEEIMELLHNPRICNHLHIPLQSGSDAVLKMMRRNYTRINYIEKACKIIQEIEHIAIGADVIVGFPGETRQLFDETLMLIQEVPFAYLHVFPFSPRPRTEAYQMNGRVSPDEVRKRADILINKGKEKRSAFIQSQVGYYFDAIIENQKNTVSTAVTSNYLKVELKENGLKKGQMVTVKVEQFENNEINALVID